MKVCCVCSKENSNYKCPRCKQPYCSSICYKSHGQSSCEPSIEEVAKNVEPACAAKSYEFPTEDTVPLETMQHLRDSRDVQDCLNNPHVRDIVMGILRDKNPTEAIRMAMTEPIFVELADACLKVVEPKLNDEEACS